MNIIMKVRFVIILCVFSYMTFSNAYAYSIFHKIKEMEFFKKEESKETRKKLKTPAKT